MKKLIALFLALVLCLGVTTAAFAETTDVQQIYWADESADCDVESGVFYTLNRVGLDIWIPGYMSVNDLDEEAIDLGFIAQFVNEDQSCVVGVTLNDQDTTYDEYYDILVGYGIEQIHQAYINDLPVIIYRYVRGENDESNVVALVTTDGYVLEFIFTGEDVDFLIDSRYIASSIQLTEETTEAEEAEETSDTPTFYWEDCAAELEAAGVEGDFYKLADMDVIVWIPSFLELLPLSDEDIAADCIAYFASEDGADFVSVTRSELGVGYDEGIELLKNSGAENISEAKVNDFYIVLYTYTNSDGQSRNSAIIFFNDGVSLNLDFSAGDADFDEYARYIIKSLQRGE